MVIGSTSWMRDLVLDVGVEAALTMQVHIGYRQQEVHPTSRLRQIPLPTLE